MAQTFVGLLLAMSLSHGKKNRNPNSPPHLNAHLFLFGNGQVPVALGDNPFANNALPGRNFLQHEMGFSTSDIAYQQQVELPT